MLFNSIEFLVFLPIVFLSYWFLFSRSVKLQNLFVVGVSYLFYGWWDGRFLLLIAFTSFFSWLSGIAIKKIRNTFGEDQKLIRLKCRWVAGGNIILNLLILGFFKYYNFFVESFVDAFSFIGVTLHTSTLYVVLPVGISFYTVSFHSW